jgi:uncharacterized membrane protein YidH (DUF202 family)
MAMYAERLKRSEGAQLLRIRWYGKERPRGDEVVFMELKTHHEKWIGDKSVKERVAIREKDVRHVLDTSTGRWDMQRAIELVRLANRTEEEELIDEQADLLLRMRELILKLDLNPCVRTRYNRIALQSTSSNNTRLTIDRDIRIINERAVTTSSIKKSWCLDDEETIPRDAVVNLPYCIFEVKVATSEGQPRFVAELEASGAIVEAKKFSKFLSGASIFNADVVKTLPWWAPDDAFAPLYNRSRGSTRADPSDEGSAASGTLSSSTIIEEAERRPLKAAISTISKKSSGDRILSNTATETLPKSGLFKRPTRSKLGAKPLSTSIAKGQRNIAPRAPPRVEPKSHFANERTFIQWISAALLIITISQLLDILAVDRNIDEASVAETWLIAMSLFIAVYALIVYYRRIYLMTNGKPYGYVDFAGPAILTASIIAGVGLFLGFSSQAKNDPVAMASSVLTHEPGRCIRRSLTSVPILELQPSGAVIDEKKGYLLVPSLHRVIALVSGLPSDRVDNRGVPVVANIPGANLEALEFVGDNLFALSEGSDGSEIISLEWTQEHLYNRHFVEVQRWKINTGGAEAMTLVPSQEKGVEPRLVVAGISEDTLSLDVFDVSSFNTSVDKVSKFSKLNKKTITKGLKTKHEKVGSMQYFDGMLYLLFDNAGVIRSFDIETGEMVQEIDLPIAELDSEEEWEGMRLERIAREGGAGNNLRGSTSLSDALVLHLALDTPAQVWSIRLDEDEGTRQWTLPDCAHAVV